MRPITQQQLGKRLAELRKRAGLKQAEVAEKLSVATETISRLERGTQWTDFETLAGLCTLYKVEWADLMAVTAGPDTARRVAIRRIMDSLGDCSSADIELVREIVAAVVKSRGNQPSKRRARA